jgi:hypothetical protein
MQRKDPLVELTGEADFNSADDIALADKMNHGRRQIIAELQKRIIGQADVIELVLLSLFVGGNSLIVGVPGLAKTLLIATLAKVLDLKFNRIQFTPSMDLRFIDYENSQRIGVDDEGNTIYDTIWTEENYFLDKIAGLNNEDGAYTAFLPSNNHVLSALDDVSEFFGNIEELDEDSYNQLLFITFTGSFTRNIYTSDNLPDTILSVTGKTIDGSMLSFSQSDMNVSNGIIHLLAEMTIPTDYFLMPIIIECDRKDNRKVSNTIYPIEQMSDSRASDGSYVFYGCNFVGDYIEFTVQMVLKTTYWFVWTGPKQGPSHYQLSVKDENTGEYVSVGDPVNNWTKGNFVPVISGTYIFNEFGTKTVRMTIVDERPLIGYNSIYLDYIKLIPDVIYNKP